MLPILLAFPILTLVTMLQVSVISRILLLSGSADLLLVILAAWALQERVTSAWHWAALAGVLFGFVSALPWFIPLIGYFMVVGIANLLQKRIWQAPILALFTVCFTGTLMTHALYYLTLRLMGHPLPFGDSFRLITLPSLLLNLIWTVPVYVLIRDLAGWLYPAAEVGE